MKSKGLKDGPGERHGKTKYFRTESRLQSVFHISISGMLLSPVGHHLRAKHGARCL